MKNIKKYSKIENNYKIIRCKQARSNLEKRKKIASANNQKQLYVEKWTSIKEEKRKKKENRKIFNRRNLKTNKCVPRFTV